MSAETLAPPIVNNTLRHVPETAFGRWFLRTWIWQQYVLLPALNDLERLIPARRDAYPVVVDLGCGSGRALGMLAARFAPQRLIGIDIDPAMLAIAAARARQDGVNVEFQCAASAQLALADASVDLLFCHQTFHHLVDQEAALREFRRVLKPRGLLLFAESTRRYIHSLPIKILFRHPMEVQRTDDEYVAMVRAAGFEVPVAQVSRPYPWWSRNDLGVGQHLLGLAPPPQGARVETVVNLVGMRA